MEKIRLFDSIESAVKQLEDQKPYQIEALGRKFCLVRKSEKLFVIQDSCPHSGASLSKGKVNYLGEIVCPLHAYRFNLLDGREADSKCSDARTYTVKEDGEGLYFEL